MGRSRRWDVAADGGQKGGDGRPGNKRSDGCGRWREVRKGEGPCMTSQFGGTGAFGAVDEEDEDEESFLAFNADRRC